MTVMSIGVRDISGGSSRAGYIFLRDFKAGDHNPGGRTGTGLSENQSCVYQYTDENDRDYVYCGVFFRNLQGCRLWFSGKPD